MKNWALHHLHLIIFIDFFIHVGMNALVILMWLIIGKLAKRTWGRDTTINICLVAMGAMIAFITWYAVALFNNCVSHYVEWWSR